MGNPRGAPEHEGRAIHRNSVGFVPIPSLTLQHLAPSQLPVNID